MENETTTNNKPPYRPSLFARFALIIIGIGVAGGMAILVLYLFPDLRPGGERFVFRERDGDTFRHQPGFVRPPDSNVVLEDFIRRKDEDGFRQPRMTTDIDNYPIIALGDSYTEGGEVPWVDVLAEALDTPVRNLGWRGFGTLQEAEVMEEFGGDNHKWVLIGYFEGNDLSNIQTAYQELQNTGAIDISRDTDEGVADNQAFEIVTDPNDNYLYPLRQINGDQTYELAYISDYIWWLNGSLETFANSRNIALLQDALAQIKQFAGDSCVGLVYMPTKGHIYFPYADPNGNRQYVLQNGLSLSLDNEGWLQFGDLTPLDYDALVANFDNQKDTVQSIADELGIIFIDLVPAFQNAAENGDITYYVYDSHWSQTGHNLAGRTIAEAVRHQADCPYR